ncbi:galactokinase [Nocardioides acrostichi]|uniref:Galactokinase n=1 Tax=Nocardioides acrostichi TaxID=2784339 RepID=A0A930YB58_9ACTN|nr:galactokinase [Nocardioides acrostichi]MBF4160164.1 galactokinase [Nocardioides acrostichi]
MRWSAPGRVNLIGEHTDYNGGLVLPIAIPQRTTVTATRRDDDLIIARSSHGDPAEVELADVGPGSPSGWTAYVAGVLWALRRDGLAAGGLEVSVDSDVPVGAGLSSSAALECAVALAADDLFDLGLGDSDEGRARLAAACVRAENEVAQAPTGGMDQAASLRCREGHALLLDCRSGATEDVPFALGAHGLTLLVVDTRVQHALGDGQYGSRRAACERAVETLGLDSLRDLEPADLAAVEVRLDEETFRRVRHVVTETDRVRRCAERLRDEDFAAVGDLFVASHASMRDDYEISCDELDVVVEAAVERGALGARMTGGGFGGSAIVLVGADHADGVREAVERGFAERGWGAPGVFEVTASAPARNEP